MTTYFRTSSEPFTAALTFRVGRSDESLMNGGITHAVEHLAMSTVSLRRLDANAFVDPLRTVFYATGDQARVLRLITTVAARLRDLPMDRLDAELGVLQAEDAGNSPGLPEMMRAYRWGSRTHGLVGYEDIGYSTLSAGEVQAWADRYFTAGNAVLWMTAPPPENFVVDLLGGAHIEPNTPEPLPFEVPAFLQGGSDTVVLTATGPRSAAFATSVRLVEHHLHEVLRTQRGRSYEIISEYEPLSRSLSYWFAGASGRPEHIREVTAAFWSSVQDVARRGPAGDELAEEKADRDGFLAGTEDPTGLLTFLADWHLIEGSAADVSSLRDENKALTPKDVGQALTRALEEAMVLVPMAADPPSGLAEFPVFSDGAVAGSAFGGKQEKKAELRVATDGVSATSDGSHFATVRWDECDVILRSCNGDRELIGRDAMRIHVCSGHWKDGFEAIRLIDKHAPEEIFVDLRPQAFPAGGWMIERDGEEMFAAPSWEHDGWALVDLTRHGGVNGLPRLAPEEDLAALDTGDLATVVLTKRGDDGKPAATEALTVMVVAASHEFYGAKLQKASTLVPALGENAGIAFAPHHVAAVRRRKLTGAAWRRIQKIQQRRS